MKKTPRLTKAQRKALRPAGSPGRETSIGAQVRDAFGHLFGFKRKPNSVVQPFRRRRRRSG